VRRTRGQPSGVEPALWLAPTDPLTIAGAVLLMVLVSALAGYLPASRASRIDPMAALHYE
jgi:ABC-type antimicrobial peptide transport system permease subunit